MSENSPKKKSSSAAKSIRSEHLKPHGPPASSRLAPGAVAVIIAAGFGLGGLGGYVMCHPADHVSASKDTATASATGGQAKAPGASQPPAGAQAQGQKAPQQAQAPQPGAYVPLAAWTPREGPENAKVTIVEFSDFQ